MRGFKLLRSVSKTYKEQGLIYFTCQTYRKQPKHVRNRIDRLIESAAGEYAGALRAYLTTGADWVWVCDNFHISAKTLERIRRRFYELW